MSRLFVSARAFNAAGRRGAARGRGFSLIEVLISIFVLALGLLGVAAVFPAVIRQQRAATDNIQGISIQRSVEQVLLSHQQLAQSNIRDLSGQITNRRGWGSLAADAQFSRNGDWSASNPLTGGIPDAAGVSINIATGDMYIGRPDGGDDISEPSFISIPLAERLIPRPYSTGGVEPRFVWDMVARRVPAGSASNFGNAAQRERGLDDDTIQLAVFIRRIESGIRPPAGLRLSDALTGRNLNNPTDRRLPVTVDEQGRPRSDGRIDANGGYSSIERRRYDVVRDVNNVPDPSLIIDDATGEMPAYFRQINQRFVDDLGVVHRVTELVRDPAGAVVALRIDPPLPADLASNVWPRDRFMLFTPQVPAAASVINVKR
ncbi:MAG: prepilin-type N-terminal cleavage/methylation domain-containing protein [Phycisphaerae bacterium]|nr:prepilin-type N-terminal cleavage/methylation domain-containing protein [Phycisphaerae bacterium]